MLVDTYAILKCSWQDRSKNLFVLHSMCMCDQICQVCIYYGAICLQIGYPSITLSSTL